MGTRSDTGTGRVDGIHAATGYPMNQYGHLLDPHYDGFTPWEIGTELYNLTAPYGRLEFAIGSGDDFVCFDYATITGPRGDWIVLDATRNSETAGFIDSADYQILPINTRAEQIAAYNVARFFAGLAFDDVPHSRKGWNQDWQYFSRSVFCHLFPLEVSKYSKTQGRMVPWVTEHMKRFGGKRIDAVIKGTLYPPI